MSKAKPIDINISPHQSGAFIQGPHYVDHVPYGWRFAKRIDKALERIGKKELKYQGIVRICNDRAEAAQQPAPVVEDTP